MSVGFSLINNTKKEKISFLNLSVNTQNEISGNPAASALVAWYIIENRGDEMQFVSDTYGDWPFQRGKLEDSYGYPDQTEKYIAILIKKGILRDDGFDYIDADEPDSCYTRRITNIWHEDR